MKPAGSCVGRPRRARLAGPRPGPARVPRGGARLPAEPGGRVGGRPAPSGGAWRWARCSPSSSRCWSAPASCWGRACSPRRRRWWTGCPPWRGRSTSASTPRCASWPSRRPRSGASSPRAGAGSSDSSSTAARGAGRSLRARRAPLPARDPRPVLRLLPAPGHAAAHHRGHGPAAAAARGDLGGGVARAQRRHRPLHPRPGAGRSRGGRAGRAGPLGGAACPIRSCSARFAGLANVVPFVGPLLSAAAAGLVVLLTPGQGLAGVGRVVAAVPGHQGARRHGHPAASPSGGASTSIRRSCSARWWSATTRSACSA